MTDIYGGYHAAEADILHRMLVKVIDKIKEPNKLEERLRASGISDSFLLSEYSSICNLIAECMDIFPDLDWLDISGQYMSRIRDGLYSSHGGAGLRVFGGLLQIGYGACGLYKVTGGYERFTMSLNQLIAEQIENAIALCSDSLGDVKASHYDVIKGIAGMAAYLLLFKEEPKINSVLKEAIHYLIKLTEDIEVFGHNVPGWHIASHNQALEREKDIYIKGNFNLGLSHGIAGPLAVLSIALREGIELKGQVQAIRKMLEELKTHYAVEAGTIYWPGRIRLEDYIEGKNGEEYIRRASWCYGTPGITRAMYLAGKAIGDDEGMNIAVKALEATCKLGEDKWELTAPIFCHGYAGMVAVAQVMYEDTKNPVFELGRDKALKKVIECYDEASTFGFYNIKRKDPLRMDSELIKTEYLDLLEGAPGILLALLSTVRPVKTDWRRMFLLS